MDEDRTEVTSEDRLQKLERETSNQADKLKRLERRIGAIAVEAESAGRTGVRSLVIAIFSVAVILLPAMTWFVDDDGDRFDSGWSIGGTGDSLFLLTGLLTTIVGILGLIAAANQVFWLRMATMGLAVLDVVCLAISPLHRESDDYPSYSDWDQTGALTLLYLALVALAMSAGLAGSWDRQNKISG